MTTGLAAGCIAFELFPDTEKFSKPFHNKSSVLDPMISDFMPQDDGFTVGEAIYATKFAKENGMVMYTAEFAEDIGQGFDAAKFAEENDKAFYASKVAENTFVKKYTGSGQWSVNKGSN